MLVCLVTCVTELPSGRYEIAMRMAATSFVVHATCQEPMCIMCEFRASQLHESRISAVCLHW